MIWDRHSMTLWLWNIRGLTLCLTREENSEWDLCFDIDIEFANHELNDLEKMEGSKSELLRLNMHLRSKVATNVLTLSIGGRDDMRWVFNDTTTMVYYEN